MPEEKTVVLKPGEVVVSQETLQKVMEQSAAAEKAAADAIAKTAGLEALFAEGKEAGTVGGDKLRERKNFEPTFRTVRVRRFPIAGNPEDLGYVIGWTDRGAYQTIDTSGVSRQVVDKIDVIFLDMTTGKARRSPEGKLQAEAVPLLEFLNRGEQVHCKVLDVKKEPKKIPTGEEINITAWDPQHGLVQTGDVIDGYVVVTDMTYTIQVPGAAQPVEVDAKYLN